MHELAPIITVLSTYRPRRSRLRRGFRRAAVALILRETRQGGEVLLIERAHRVGDPWSGHMALPGGRMDTADDASASTAACRETREETGLVVSRGDGIGRLSDRTTLDHRRRAPMIVSPFVYRLAGDQPIRCNHEIAATRWLPLARLDEPIHRTTTAWPMGRLSVPVPCYYCAPHQRLWGLTLLILDELLDVARRGPSSFPWAKQLEPGRTSPSDH